MERVEEWRSAARARPPAVQPERRGESEADDRLDAVEGSAANPDAERHRCAESAGLGVLVQQAGWPPSQRVTDPAETFPEAHQHRVAYPCVVPAYPPVDGRGRIRHQSDVTEIPLRRRCDEAGACVIVPVFNNVSTVGDVVRDALGHSSTVLVCDDGSTDGSGAAAEAAGAVVLRHAHNEGKGVALRTLLAEAHRRGFRHAISMDADGQHLASDLPGLANALIEEPGSLVLGVRNLVAAGAPPSSEFGRRCSNWWIWFETGLRLPDTQSGFRGYPVPEVIELGARHRRYAFENDVILRAAWAGIPIRSRPITVVYPANRATHFRLVIDNVRIVALNTLAVLRHPLPLPLGRSLFRIPRHPGWSLFEIRRWAWLGGSGPLWRGLAAVGGILGATTLGGDLAEGARAGSPAQWRELARCRPSSQRSPTSGCWPETSHPTGRWRSSLALSSPLASQKWRGLRRGRVPGAGPARAAGESSDTGSS